MITAISMIGAILGGHVGRTVCRTASAAAASMIAALLGGILMVPLWAYAPSMALLVMGAFLMQFMVQGAWGVIPAHLSELSPDSVRGFLPGFAYQCGVLVASSVVYIEAVFAKQHELRDRDGAHRGNRFRAGCHHGGHWPGETRRRVRAVNSAG